MGEFYRVKDMFGKWDRRFLSMAKLVASWSKDPSTQTGAVIVAPDRRVVSVGFNGFPQGIRDDHRLHDRPTKYEIIVHCERNALIFAREPLHGCTLYTWPFPSCRPCAALMLQAGIVRHVAPEVPPELEERWGKSCDGAIALYEEGGGSVTLYTPAEIE